MSTSYDSPLVTIDGETAPNPCALVVGHDSDAEPLLDAGFHGPFLTVREAQEYARSYREQRNIPGHENVEPTAEENDAWTALGWTFGIFVLNYERTLGEP